MANHSSLASQLVRIIDSIILPLEMAKQHVDIKRVADQVSEAIDPDGLAPELLTYCATLHYRGQVGKRLANRHDKADPAESEGATEEMFGSSLQEYYAESKNLYVPREDLTEVGYERNRSLMLKKMNGYAEHLNAFEAWWLEKQSKATA